MSISTYHDLPRDVQAHLSELETLINEAGDGGHYPVEFDGEEMIGRAQIVGDALDVQAATAALNKIIAILREKTKPAPDEGIRKIHAVGSAITYARAASSKPTPDEGVYGFEPYDFTTLQSITKWLFGDGTALTADKRRDLANLMHTTLARAVKLTGSGKK